MSAPAEKHPDYQRDIQKLIRRELLATANDRSREVTVFVAEQDDGLVGVMASEPWDLEDADLLGEHVLVIAVSPDHRNRGVGASLIRHLIRSSDQPMDFGLTFMVHRDNLAMRRLLGEHATSYTPPDDAPGHDILTTNRRTLLQDLERQIGSDRDSGRTQKDYGLAG